MLTVTVNTMPGVLDVFEIDATSWHIAENGNLHLHDSDRSPVASFAATKWLAVQKDAVSLVNHED